MRGGSSYWAKKMYGESYLERHVDPRWRDISNPRPPHRKGASGIYTLILLSSYLWSSAESFISQTQGEARGHRSLVHVGLIDQPSKAQSRLEKNGGRICRDQQKFLQYRDTYENALTVILDGWLILWIRCTLDAQFLLGCKESDIQFGFCGPISGYTIVSSLILGNCICHCQWKSCAPRACLWQESWYLVTTQIFRFLWKMQLFLKAH